jgi:hypothetical protein
MLTKNIDNRGWCLYLKSADCAGINPCKCMMTRQAEITHIVLVSLNQRFRFRQPHPEGEK